MPNLPSLVRRCVFLGALFLGVGSGRAHADNFVVTNTSDASGTCGTGSCSLRQAITSANANTSTSDSITFASTVTGTISLSASDSDTTDGASAFVLKGDVSIQGPGANVLTVQRTTSATSFRLFLVSSGVSARVSGLTLSKGSSSTGVPGGGFFNRGSLSLSDCVVTGNTASTYGGAIYNAGVLSVQNSTISANTASGGGTSGGIDNGSGTDSPVGTVTLVNSTLSGNTASSTAGRGNGGALWTGNGATISNCTIANNSVGSVADNGASGILAVGGTVTISNTIVAANQSNTTLPDLVSSGGAFASGGYNLIGNVGGITTLTGAGDQKGTASSALNPKLGTLANNGGATLTQALLTGSPAINAGNPSFDSTTLAYDQRGVGYARVANSRIDIGAFEVPSDAPVVTSVTIAPTNPKTNDTLTAQVKGNSSTLTYTYQWNKNDTALLNETNATLDLSKEGNGDAGDKVSVTVVAKDGTRSSAAVTSSSVTIVNSAVTLANVAIAPTNPITNSLLTASADASDPDGGTLTKTYQWKKNNAPINGATNATLDLSQANNGDKGDTISVVVTASDGATSASLESSAVTVGNTAPALSSVSISPSNPTTDTVLAATSIASDADSADNGNLTYTYQWSKNGTALPNEKSSTLDLSKAGNGDSGDTISVIVTVSDGTATASLEAPAVTIGDSTPVLTDASISPANPKTNDILTATPQSSNYSYQWNKNGAPLPSETGATLDLGKEDNGDKGDEISVTVVARSGTNSSDPVTSPSVTIINSAPIVTDVSITPADPGTNEELHVTYKVTDADASDKQSSRVISWQWKKNAAPLPGEVADALLLSKPGNGDKNDKISVVVRASDGTDATDSEATPVTIMNTTPVLSGVAINPNNPTTDDLLSVAKTASDVDNDDINYSYQWFKNGTLLSKETGSSLNLATPGNGDVGDTISVIVAAADGTSVTSQPATVTVGNSVPMISDVSISPANPTTKRVLTANVTASDTDDKSGTSLKYDYQWKKNNKDIDGAKNSTLDLSTAGNGDKGDSITVSVTASDATSRSGTITSPAVTVLNSAPVISKFAITPDTANTSSTLSLTLAASDEDNDTLTYTYQWKKNGAVISGATGKTLNLATAGNGDRGDKISVVVTVSDGSTAVTKESPVVTVGNALPVVSTVIIAPAGPRTNDVMSSTIVASDADKDTLTYTYQWKKNKVSISGATTDKLDLSKVGNGDKGDKITLAVTASDGIGRSFTTISSTVTILDSAPAISKVTLSPDPLKTKSLLKATVAASDADKDTLIYTYQWKKNKVAISGATAEVLDLSVAGNGDKGDEMSVTVTAFDGTKRSYMASSPVLIVGNTAPEVVSVNLTPTNPKLGDSVLATVDAKDDDSDAISYVYKWSRTRGGQTTVLRTATKTPSADGAGANTSTQATTGGSFMVGDVLTVSVVVKDASGTSVAKSASVTIVNSPITVSITSLAPATVTTNSVITATVASQDADKTPATYTYSWSKVSGGKTTLLQTTTSVSTTSTLDLSKVGYGNKGDSILFSVKASDGASFSSASRSVTVANSLPSVTKVTLSPASPQTTSKLVATVATSDDDVKDGVDKLTLFYKWTVGTRFLSSETTSTLDLSKYNTIGAGDTVTLEVRASDGNATSATLKAGAKITGSTTNTASSAPNS